MEGVMNGKLVWKSGVSFTAETNSGIKVNMDTPVDRGGGGTGATPMELILVSLGGCTAMDVISILEKKRQEVTNFEILLHADRATEHPKVFTDITIEFIVTGHNVDEEAVKRAVELSETKYCSASAMLSKAAKIHSKITVKEG
jgi:putative redox protein